VTVFHSQGLQFSRIHVTAPAFSSPGAMQVGHHFHHPPSTLQYLSCTRRHQSLNAQFDCRSVNNFIKVDSAECFPSINYNCAYHGTPIYIQEEINSEKRPRLVIFSGVISRSWAALTSRARLPARPMRSSHTNSAVDVTAL
jgi:hypothetical protein